MVPEDKVEELRMQLRIQGIPKAAPNGSEMLDKPSFGDSSLKERAKFMMDLAVKVERQILMITPVQAVKVNVALPQQTDLIRRRDTDWLEIETERMMSPTFRSGSSNSFILP